MSPVAFVTGASSGTGRAIALALGRGGYRLVLVGRNAEALRQTGTDSGAPHLVTHADLRDAAQLDTALHTALDWTGGRADALVNAAGITGPIGNPIGEIPTEAFDDTIAVNLRAPFLMLSALLPIMRRQGAGAIVSIGGTHGLRGRAGRAAYVSSKWAFRGLHRTAALEAGPDGVNVNLVMPGPIRVPRMEQAWQAEADSSGTSFDAVLDAYTARMGGALGRLNTPEDVVTAVLFLLSPAARNITGQELVIDSGTMAGASDSQ